ncbi:TIGR00730 family Rossman fold protein [Candidatus Dependentiae bacterium]
MKFKYFKECCNILTHSIKVGWELMRSFAQISKLNMPVITIFGGAKEGKTGDYPRKAFDLSKRLVENGIPVLTGGGPGIMESANCGASSASSKMSTEKKHTLGIAVKGIDTWFESSCYYNTIHVNYFFMRKWLLTRYSVGFIVFPGGIGTLDELFDVLNLMKHHRIPPFPIVLIGETYWKPLLSLLKDSALKGGFIDERLAKLFMVTDDIDKAYKIMYDSCNLFRNLHKSPPSPKPDKPD